MPQQEHIERVWEIADAISVCMVTTHAGNRMRSRPMHAFPDQDAGCFWFITDTRGLKDEDIEAAPDVCLNFADLSDNTYLSVTGHARIIRDPAKAEELWNAEAQVWWPNGPRDPVVRVLRVEPDQAEYWDARGNSFVVAMKLVAARVSGKEPEFENKKVSMR